GRGHINERRPIPVHEVGRLPDDDAPAPVANRTVPVVFGPGPKVGGKNHESVSSLVSHQKRIANTALADRGYEDRRPVREWRPRYRRWPIADRESDLLAIWIAFIEKIGKQIETQRCIRHRAAERIRIQPLTLPLTSPLTMCFCIVIKNMSIGMSKI